MMTGNQLANWLEDHEFDGNLLEDTVVKIRIGDRYLDITDIDGDSKIITISVDVN